MWGLDGPGRVGGLGESEIKTGARVCSIWKVEKVVIWASGSGFVVLGNSHNEPGLFQLAERL